MSGAIFEVSASTKLCSTFVARYKEYCKDYLLYGGSEEGKMVKYGIMRERENALVDVFGYTKKECSEMFNRIYEALCFKKSA